MKTVAAVRVAQKGVDLLVFPAGYFQLPSTGKVHAFAADVAARLAEVRPSFGVVWGMDVHGGKKQRSKVEQQFDEEHPFFISYRGAAGELLTLQQVSVTAAEGNADSVDAKWGNRALLLPGTSIALLICGECWSDTLLSRVAKPECRALVVAAHRNVKMHRDPSGYGRLSWHLRLEAHQRSSGVPTVLSEHTRSPDRHPYAWPAEIAEQVLLDDLPGTVTLRLATIP
jgi:predicted amidohydrolase